MSLLDDYNKLEDRLKKKYGNRKPTTEPPSFPRSLSNISDEELIDLLGAFAEWQAFAGVEVGMIDGNRKHHENMYKKKKREKSKEVQKNASKDAKKYEIDTEVENAPEVLTEMEKMSYYEAAYKQELSYKEAFERYCFVMSRELTRRLKSQEYQVRKERFGYLDDSYDNSENTPEKDGDIGESFDFDGL